jgi:hypothetical protein
VDGLPGGDLGKEIAKALKRPKTVAPVFVS